MPMRNPIAASVHGFPGSDKGRGRARRHVRPRPLRSGNEAVPDHERVKAPDVVAGPLSAEEDRAYRVPRRVQVVGAAVAPGHRRTGALAVSRLRVELLVVIDADPIDRLGGGYEAEHRRRLITIAQVEI